MVLSLQAKPQIYLNCIEQLLHGAQKAKSGHVKTTANNAVYCRKHKSNDYCDISMSLHAEAYLRITIMSVYLPAILVANGLAKTEPINSSDGIRILSPLNTSPALILIAKRQTTEAV